MIDEKENSYFSQKTQEILMNLKKDKNFPTEKLSPETIDYFNYLALKAEIEEVDEPSFHLLPRSSRPATEEGTRSAIEEKEILAEIQFCLREIKSSEIKNKLDQISQEIKKAEEVKDLGKIEKLSQEFNQLATELASGERR